MKRMENDRPFSNRLSIAGVVLLLVWGVSLVYWLGFIERTDLYGTSQTISTVFGYVMMAAISGGMLFVFDVIGKLERRIRTLEDIALPNRSDPIDHMCDDFGSPRL